MATMWSDLSPTCTPREYQGLGDLVSVGSIGHRRGRRRPLPLYSQRLDHPTTKAAGNQRRRPPKTLLLRMPSVPPA
jgi:hypothetical protein